LGTLEYHDGEVAKNWGFDCLHKNKATLEELPPTNHQYKFMFVIQIDTGDYSRQ
jgi:hypothetical protein